MSHFPLLLSLAHFGSHLPPRRPDLRGSPSGKVGTIPRAVGCACAVCDPDDERGGDDLDSFWREQTPEEREAISAAYVKAYGDRPYGDQSHAAILRQPDFLPAGLLRAARAAAGAVVALYPCEAPEWAKVRPL